MAYPRQMLNDDEEIVLDRHPHWSFMLNAMVMIAGSFVVTLVIAVLDWRFSWIGLLCLALALIGSLGTYLRWRCTNFVVTTDRIVIRSGVLSKSGIEIPLDRVTNLSYKQAFWERLLGTGALVVESAGESGHQLFTYVAHPSQVQNIIYKQADLAERNNHQGTGTNGVNHSIPEQIDKLDQLRQRGVITDAEFHAKKQDLLNRM